MESMGCKAPGRRSCKTSQKDLGVYRATLPRLRAPESCCLVLGVEELGFQGDD